MQKQAELYRGKAKTVYSTENPDLLVLEFRNDTSAGDGARIEQFDRKGMVNNKFNYFIMTKLVKRVSRRRWSDCSLIPNVW